MISSSRSRLTIWKNERLLPFHIWASSWLRSQTVAERPMWNEREMIFGECSSLQRWLKNSLFRQLNFKLHIARHQCSNIIIFINKKMIIMLINYNIVVLVISVIGLLKLFNQIRGWYESSSMKIVNVMKEIIWHVQWLDLPSLHNWALYTWSDVKVINQIRLTNPLYDNISSHKYDCIFWLSIQSDCFRCVTDHQLFSVIGN